MASITPIMVECVNCGHGHLWIPKEVQEDFDQQIAALQEEIAWKEREIEKLKRPKENNV